MMNRFLEGRSRLITVFMLGISLVISACDQANAPQSMPETQPPPVVTVAPPVVRDVTDWDEFTGRMYAMKSVEVRARVSGYLKSVNFTEGAIVEAGDLLYVIDPRPYQAVLDQAEAELTRARASLELAENDLARAERLYQSRAISEEELDSRSKQKREALASMEAARATIESARLNMEFTHIRAPITGRISYTRVTEGNLISGGEFDSTLLTSIVSLDPIYVYFTADEQLVLHYSRMDMAGTRESSRVKSNPVFLKLADEEEYKHEGHMDFVDNQIDLGTGTMRARAIVDNPDHLLVPGMFADVKLLGEGPYEALLVPDAAINVDQTIQFVYIVNADNMVERRQVKTGRLHGGLRVITEGLEKQDRVIINGIQRARAGMEVAPETGSVDAGDNQQG